MYGNRKHCVIFIRLLLILTNILGIGTSAAEKRLLKHLFEKYDKDVRPVLHDNETVVVQTKHTISQILDVQERNEIFVTAGWSSLRWKDAYLTWLPSNYNGIRAINISPGKVWIPDIVLYNDIKSDKVFGSKVDQVQNRLTITHDGSIIWGLKATFATKCHFDIYYFPFDTQTCEFRYGSWSYEKGRIDVDHNSLIKINYHARHNGWHILSHTTNMVRKNYTGGTYESVLFSLTIRRRAFFGIINLVLSPIIVGVLISLSFVLPAASGERLALSVTLLLAMIFFIINVTYFIPNDNVTVPIIYQFFVATLFEIVLLNITLILSMQLYHKKPYDPPMPMIVEKIVLGKLSYFLGIRKNEYSWENSLIEKCDDIENIIDAGFLTNDYKMPAPTLYAADTRRWQRRHFTCPEKSRMQSHRRILKEWRIAALTIDRCLFLLFSMTWLLTFLVFLFKATMQSGRHDNHPEHDEKF